MNLQKICRDDRPGSSASMYFARCAMTAADVASSGQVVALVAERTWPGPEPEPAVDSWPGFAVGVGVDFAEVGSAVGSVVDAAAGLAAAGPAAVPAGELVAGPAAELAVVELGAAAELAAAVVWWVDSTVSAAELVALPAEVAVGSTEGQARLDLAGSWQMEAGAVVLAEVVWMSEVPGSQAGCGCSAVNVPVAWR
jgi:hypothetical protein